MNKKALIIVVVVLGLAVIGGGVIYANNQNEKKEQEKMAMEKKSEAEAMMKKDESVAMEKENDAMVKDEAMEKHGSYITLADYNANISKYTDSEKVYFFHASWCSICQGIDKEINTDMSKIPAGVTIIKTDFDSSTDLRQKYGVTTQYTFVQVDSNGNEIAQWSATNLDKAIEGIKS
jgi:thiol-disulfide isomerase/thioredoxin